MKTTQRTFVKDLVDAIMADLDKNGRNDIIGSRAAVTILGLVMLMNSGVQPRHLDLELGMMQEALDGEPDLWQPVKGYQGYYKCIPACEKYKITDNDIINAIKSDK